MTGTLSIPGDVAEWFKLGGEAFSRRLGVGGEQKPIGGCGMGVRHTVFEPVVA